MLSPEDHIVRSLQEELGNFDQVIDQTAVTRQTIVTKLSGLLHHLDSLPVDDDKRVSSVLAITNTTLKALDAQEASAVRRVNTKIKQQDQRRADNTAVQVTELLQRMSTGSGTGNEPLEINLDAESAALLEKFTLEGHAILETELRADPDDLS